MGKIGNYSQNTKYFEHLGVKMKKTTLYHILLWIMVLCLIGLIVWRFLPKEENTIANAQKNIIEVSTKNINNNKQLYTYQDQIYVATDISNIRYQNFKENGATINSNGRYLNVSYYNMPKGKFTCEVINHVTYDPSLRISFLILQYLSSGVSAKYLSFNENIGHVTFEIDTNTSFQLQVMTQNNNQTVPLNINFDTYFYYGDYVPGFGQGFQTGYEHGLAEGSGIAKYGIWQNATVDGKFTYDVNNKDVVINGTNLKPDFEYGAIYFKTIAKQYEIYPNDPDIYLSSANISIYLNEPMTYNPSLRPIVNSGTSLINVTLIDSAGKRYDLEVVTEQGYNILKFSNPDIQEVNNIVQIDFNVGRAADLLYEVYLISLDQSYYGGYSEGYNKGLDSGRSEGIVIGREQGYKNGYEEGKNASLSEQTGFSVITSMLSNVMSIFELKIFGWFGLGDIIGIALIFGIVLFALKLIRG